MAALKSPSRARRPDPQVSVFEGAPAGSRARLSVPVLLLALLVAPALRVAAASGPPGYPPVADALARLSRDLEPSVVQIISFRPIGPSPRDLEGAGSVSRLEPSRETLWASGVVLDEQGTILTCAETAQPGDSLEIRTAAGRRFGARFLALDAPLGVSLIQASGAEGLAPIRLSGPAPFRRGSSVLVLHYVAEGQEPVLKLGAMTAPPAGPGDQNTHLRLALADCHGACGGAVVDADGHFCGIVVDIQAEAEAQGGQGEVRQPADLLEYDDVGVLCAGMFPDLAARLENQAERRFGYLGVQARVGDELSREPDPADSTRGPIFVSRVFPGSPAEVAGFLPGDQILAIDGREVSGRAQVIRQLAETPPGSEIQVKLLRRGVPLTLYPRVGDRSSLEWMQREDQLNQIRQRRIRRTIQELEIHLHQIEEPKVAQR